MAEGQPELDAMKIAYEALQPLDENTRSRAMRWLIEALDVSSLTRSYRDFCVGFWANEHRGFRPLYGRRRPPMRRRPGG